MTKNCGWALCNGLGAFNDLLVMQFAMCGTPPGYAIHVPTLGYYVSFLPRYIANANEVPS